MEAKYRRDEAEAKHGVIMASSNNDYTAKVLR